MDLAEIEEIISEQEVSFIASIDEEGCPNVKAMLPPRKRVGLKEFYFTTNTCSKKGSAVFEEPECGYLFLSQRGYEVFWGNAKRKDGSDERSSDKR